MVLNITVVETKFYIISEQYPFKVHTCMHHNFLSFLEDISGLKRKFLVILNSTRLSLLSLFTRPGIGSETQMPKLGLPSTD